MKSTFKSIARKAETDERLTLFETFVLVVIGTLLLTACGVGLAAIAVLPMIPLIFFGQWWIVTPIVIIEVLWVILIIAYVTHRDSQ